MKIVTELQVKLTDGDQARVFSKNICNLQAYLKFLEGRGHFRLMLPNENVLAKQKAEEAIALDPEAPRAYILLGYTHVMDLLYRSSASPLESLARAEESARKSLFLDDSSAGGHHLMCLIHTFKREHEKSIAEGELAIAIEPNHADGHALLAMCLHYAGRHKSAITSSKKALRLNPLPPAFYFWILGHAYRHSGKCEEAIRAYKKALRLSPHSPEAATGLVSAYVLLGKKEQARTAVEQLIEVDPDFSCDYWEIVLPYKEKAGRELYFNSPKKAGLK
jgi:tetratricopeptide (TPR) repeat protein